MQRFNRFAWLFRPRSSRSSGRRTSAGNAAHTGDRSAARPAVESLEGRTLMSAAATLPLSPTIPFPPPPLPLGAISGVKYNDLNANGVRDAFEPGLANWRIYLDGNNNGVLDAGERNTLTNAAGQYSFNFLGPGTYHVREVLQPGWRQTAPAVGSYTVFVPLFGHVTGRDFGNTRTVRISGTVFSDANQNGVRDFGEAGLSGFTVYLDGNGNGKLDAGEKSVASGAGGAYVFDGLPAGFYHVRVAPRLFYHQTSPAGGAYNLLLFSGTTASSRNFGEKFWRIIINPVPIPVPPIPIPDPGPLTGPGPL